MKVKLSRKTEELLKLLPEKAAEPIGRCGAFMANEIRNDSVRAFEVGKKGTPNSGYMAKWAPWKPSTRKRYARERLAKRRARRNKKVAKGRGYITHSLLYASGALARGIVAGFKVTAKTRALISAGVAGSVAHYGKPLHEGYPQHNLVARPFVGITPQGIAIVRKYVQEQLKRSMTGSA